jgi:superfamily II DNA helicase RecQ
MFQLPVIRNGIAIDIPRRLRRDKTRQRRPTADFVLGGNHAIGGVAYSSTMRWVRGVAAWLSAAGSSEDLFQGDASDECQWGLQSAILHG